jgi:hypothetical protein
MNNSRFYLFSLHNGKKRMGYGPNVAEALSILRLRMTAEEMAEILPDAPVEIRQQDIRKYIHELG